MVQFKPFQDQIPAPLIIGGAFIAIFVVALIIFQLSASLIVSAAFLIVSSIAAYLYIQKLEEKSTKAKTPESASQSDLSRTENKLNLVAKRMSALETRMSSIETMPDSASDPIAASILEELETVGHALRDIADIIVEHHRILVEVDRIGHAEIQALPPVAPNTNSDIPEPPKPTIDTDPADENGTIISMSKRQMETMLRQEMLNGRIGAYSQNIASLPAKKNAFSVLSFSIENGQGDVITENDLRRMGVSRNLLLLFDRVRFGYTYEIARHRTGSSLPLFCPISVVTLLEPSATSEMMATVKRHAGLAEKINFLFSEETLAACGDIGRENMARLKKAGISFALEISTDLMIDIVTLAGMGFRAILCPIDLLRGAESGEIRTELHPSDLPGLMDRYNMEIVATQVSTDRDLADLRKFNVYLAMGPLLGIPKLVRFTALEETSPDDGPGTLAKAGLSDADTAFVERIAKPREKLRVTPLRDHLPKVGS